MNSTALRSVKRLLGVVGAVLFFSAGAQTPCTTTAPCLPMMMMPAMPAPTTSTSSATTALPLITTTTTITTPATTVPVRSTTIPAATAVAIPAPATSATAASVSNQAVPNQAQPAAPPPPPPPPSAVGSPNSYSPPAFSPAAAVKVVSEPTHEPGQVLVLWDSEDAASKGIATLLQRYQLRPRQRFNLGQLGLTVVMLSVPTATEATALRDKLRREQTDWIVDLNARSVSMQGTTVSGEASARLYAQKMLRVPSPTAHTAAPLASNAFRLGVIDTAIDPALLQADALNGTVITQRSVLGPADVAAAPTHGSTVLLLIAAKARANGFAGAAPALQLAWVNAMRLQGDKPSTNSLLLSVALDWLVGKQVALINMSLGGQGDAVLKTVVARVLAKRVAIVAAVGNNPASDALPMYPAAYDGVWAVTAVDANEKRYSQANRAANAAWAAPGVELWVPINATKEGGASSYSYVSGTSFATALASAALAWQPPPFWGLTGAEKKSKLCSIFIKPQNDRMLGCGIVQASVQP